MEMIPIETYNDFYVMVQRWVYDFNGVINKIDYTDKGYLLIVLLECQRIRTMWNVPSSVPYASPRFPIPK